MLTIYSGDCSGVGYKQCSKCDGEESIVCDKCQGEGFYIENWKALPTAPKCILPRYSAIQVAPSIKSCFSLLALIKLISQNITSFLAVPKIPVSSPFYKISKFKWSRTIFGTLDTCIQKTSKDTITDDLLDKFANFLKALIPL